jgi:hypothetical protein
MRQMSVSPGDIGKSFDPAVVTIFGQARAAARWLAIVVLGLGLTACGGGGGGGDDDGGGGGGGTPTGTIAGTVTDQFNTPIENATVTATVGSQSFNRRTAADGTVTLTNIPTGTAGVVVTASGFKNSASQNLAITANNTTSFTQILERSTQAAGGFVLSRVVGAPTNNGQTITFSLQLLVVNESSQAVTTLTAADFTLQPCTPDTSKSGPECIRAIPADDTAYTVPTATPNPFAQIPANAAKPYAAAMLLDQSNSIETSDPTDARIFASKVFMDGVGVNDRVVLAAFADNSATEPSNVAKIPTPPLTIFGTFTADGDSFFDELDQLAKLEGGTTPLYSSLDSMVDYTQANAPTGIAGQLKAVVLFSDGEDTDPACLNERDCLDASVANALAKEVDIFTIGLSDKVNFESMAELADRANGVFLFAESAEQLIPIYGALGNLLSDSLAKYEVTFTIQAAEANTFVSGRTILGSIQVSTASNPVNLPIIVRIP